MSANLKPVLHGLALALHIPGAMALLSLPVAAAFAEWSVLRAFVWTAAVSLLLGQALFWPTRGAEEMRLRHAMAVAGLAWIAVPLVGMLPFLLAAYDAAALSGSSDSLRAFQSVWNALFEAVSGFTSTGLTVAAEPRDLPKALQWWRSFMQWIGGVGVIVLMLSVFHPSGDANRLFFAEAREGKILPDVISSVRTIWWIYLLYTAFGVALLRAVGMPWWDAVNYGLTGIATGGFGVSADSLAAYGAAPRIVMILLMLLGSISFAAHYRILVKRELRLLWREVEYRALWLLLAVGAPLLLLENLWWRGSWLWLDSLFQWASALCTAGFQTVSLQDWSPTAHLALSFAMICGGAAGATTGGLKLRRVVTLAEAALYRIRRITLHPWLFMEHKPLADHENRRVAGPHVEAAAVMALLWLGTLLAGVLALLHAVEPATPFTLVVLEAASALGNVGLSSGIAGPELSWAGKAVLIAMMWVGRLEILPALVLIAWLLARR